MIICNSNIFVLMARFFFQYTVCFFCFCLFLLSFVVVVVFVIARFSHLVGLHLINFLNFTFNCILLDIFPRKQYLPSEGLLPCSSFWSYFINLVCLFNIRMRVSTEKLRKWLQMVTAITTFITLPVKLMPL